MASSLQVVVQEKSVVAPSAPKDPCSFYLHNIDQQLFFYLEMNFIFRPSKSRSNDNAVELLKESLAKLLDSYYFVAGRYNVNEEEKRLELNCNAAGVLFAGAASSVSIEELGDLTAPNAAFKSLLLYPDDISCIEDIPLLTVQVTTFSCGGLVIGFCASHVVFDGISLYQFFSDYASIARGGGAERVAPTPDRSFMEARCPLRISYPHNELAVLPDIPAKVLFYPADYDQVSLPVPPGFYFKTFCFTPKMLNNLKKKVVNESKGTIKVCSAFEALSALIWQARTKALHLDSQAPAKLFIVVDVRNKFQEHVPEGFIGNAIVAAPCTSVTSNQLCNNGLSFSVAKVQQTIRSATEEYARSHLDWCELNHGLLDLPGGLLITSWSKLGYDKVDFGWGKPAYVAPLVHNRTDYVILLPNCQGDGGVDVFVAMKFQQMNEFERNLVL